MSEPDKQTKWCPKCGEIKPLAQYHRSKNVRDRQDGRDRYCAECRNRMINRNRASRCGRVRDAPWGGKSFAREAAREAKVVERQAAEDQRREAESLASMRIAREDAMR